VRLQVRTVYQSLRPGRVAAQFRCRGFERLQQFVHWNFRREGYIHEGLRPVPAEIAHSSDLAIGDGHYCAARVAHHCPPQRQMLDFPDRVSDLDRVTDAELIFKHDIKAGDNVAYQILCAETQRHARQTGNRRDRRDIDAEFRQCS